MKVLVAGASGAIGKQLVPRLVAAGHSVTGLTRSAAGTEAVRALGGEPAIADAFDPEAVARAVAEAEPEAIVHELTSLSESLDMRYFDRDFALTNRLRTEGTDHLLSAAHAVGVHRFVAQSFAGWNYARTGALILDRDGALIGAMSLDLAEDRVVGVNSVVNPDKLAHLGPVGDMRALLRPDRGGSAGER